MKTAILIFLVLYAASCENIYKDTKYAVTTITKNNWDSQVNAKRNIGQTLIVHFYKSGDGRSYEFRNTFNDEAKKSQGIYQFIGIDCDEDLALCSREEINRFPALKIYPPVPIPPPAVDFDLDLKKAVRISAGYVQSKVQEIDDENFSGKIGENPAVPKIILFTDKPGVPLLYKALSLSFDVLVSSFRKN